MIKIARKVFERYAYDAADADAAKLDRRVRTEPAHAAGEEQQIRQRGIELGLVRLVKTGIENETPTVRERFRPQILFRRIGERDISGQDRFECASSQLHTVGADFEVQPAGFVKYSPVVHQ